MDVTWRGANIINLNAKKRPKSSSFESSGLSRTEKVLRERMQRNWSLIRKEQGKRTAGTSQPTAWTFKACVLGYNLIVLTKTLQSSSRNKVKCKLLEHHPLQSGNSETLGFIAGTSRRTFSVLRATLLRAPCSLVAEWLMSQQPTALYQLSFTRKSDPSAMCWHLGLLLASSKNCTPLSGFCALVGGTAQGGQRDDKQITVCDRVLTCGGVVYSKQRGITVFLNIYGDG